MQRKDISTFIVLKAAEYAHRSMMPTYEFIRAWTQAPEKVIYAAMEREYDKGLIECGVSLRTAWLTDDGINKLKWLESED